MTFYIFSLPVCFAFTIVAHCGTYTFCLGSAVVRSISVAVVSSHQDEDGVVVEVASG